MRPHRRAFMGAAAAGVAAVAGGRSAAAAGPVTGSATKPLPFKISLAQWSLHQALQRKSVDHLDFVRIANGFGIDAVEYVN